MWETLHLVKAGVIQADQGNAVATQAREILRTMKIQLQVASHFKRPISADLIEFSGKV